MKRLMKLVNFNHIRFRCMKFLIIIFDLLLFNNQVFSQNSNKLNKNTSIPVIISWVDSIPGDFSFTKDWDYPLGVERKAYGKAGCADGGFCPERCYAMLDSNGIVLKDSSEIFYQLLDTTHLFHTIQCDAWCYEWAGTDFMWAYHKTGDTVFCYTPIGIATHCSLQLNIIRDLCYAVIDLISVFLGGNAKYYCLKGHISIDKNFWKEGFIKAEFDFNFEHKENPELPMFWKGKIFTKIETNEEGFDILGRGL